MVGLRLLLLASAAARRLEDDADFALYDRFLRSFRSSPAERRQLNSYSEERFGHFKATLRDIEQRRARDPGASYDINQFSDLSEDEFLSQWTSGPGPWNETLARHKAEGFNAIDPQLLNRTHRLEMVRRLSGSHSTTIDWRFHMGGKVSRTKNQGGCGSCWAFAAIQQMESDHAIANGNILTLSAQQITSCTYEPSRSGCNGGWPKDGIESAIRMGGIMLEADYPYTGRSPPCAYDSEKAVTQPIAAWHTQGPETPMIARIFTSPMTIAIDAGAYKSYSGGIMGCNAGGRSINHAIQAVGYNGDENYWVVRNSWGASWGMGGYAMQVPRGVPSDTL